MLRTLLICGLVAGLCGGLLATGFASLAGEPAVDRAIAYEDAADAGMPHEPAAPAPVSRALQKSAGLLTAALVYGLALGGIFSLVFAVAYGRVVQGGPRATAYGLAAAAFVVVYLVPFLKYPASPPGATDPATIGRRTALYATMIAISIAAAVAAARVRSVAATRCSGHRAGLVAGLVFVGIAAAAGLVLPSVHEIPKNFPATTLWRFREASVGMQAVLWVTIGLVFGTAAQRAMTGQRVVPRLRRRTVTAGVAE
jgi:predicted cobalt transporter CbtA